MKKLAWVTAMMFLIGAVYADKPERLTKKGGMVSSPDGIVEIVVPEGAVSKTAKISILPDYLNEGEIMAYVIETSKEIELSQPLMVTFYMPEDSSPYVKVYDNGVEIPGVVDLEQGTVSIELYSFSKHRLSVNDPLQFLNVSRKPRIETVEFDTAEGHYKYTWEYIEFGIGAGRLWFNGDKLIAGYEDTYSGEYELNNWGRIERNSYPQRTQKMMFYQPLGIADLYLCNFMLFWEW